MPDSCKLEWFDEIARSTTSVIEARLANRSDSGRVGSRKNVLAGHLGIAGAAYARDAAMAAHLAGEHPVEEWRRFGALYGLMRQLHADHVRSTVDEDGNPLLAVPPLLAAHAFQQGNTGVRRELARLRREEPSGDPDRHRLLRELLRSPRAVAATHKICADSTGGRAPCSAGWTPRRRPSPCSSRLWTPFSNWPCPEPGNSSALDRRQPGAGHDVP